VVSLISGGGSALLVAPCNGITLSEKQRVTELLLKAGANINELNTIRKHISGVKGGRLAELAFPAKTLSLILSDVIGDRLDVISSGPTSPDKTTYQDALGVISKYNLTDRVPQKILSLLKDGVQGNLPETPKEGNPIFEKVENIIVGSNRMATDAARIKASELGFDASVISTEIQGEAKEVGSIFAKKAIEIRRSNVRKPICLIAGGETTVTVKGNGTGGRNMEMALSFALEIDGIDGITFLSAGSDGTDGPTDAAGAFADGQTVKMAKAKGLAPEVYLKNNDSYNLFDKINGLFITGPTGTNVMDIQIILIA
jgi:glycerate-2-kinase